MKTTFYLLTVSLLLLGCILKPKKSLSEDVKPVDIEFFEMWNTSEIIGEWNAVCNWVDQNDSLKKKNINLHSLIKVSGTSQFGFVKVADVASVKSVLELTEVKNILPEGLEFIWSIKPTTDHTNNNVLVLYIIKVPVSGEATITGNHVKKVLRGYDLQTRKNTINLTMTQKGTDLWAKMTKENMGKFIAIAADRKVISCPQVLNAIVNGDTQISGDFTVKEVEELVAGINAGRSNFKN